MARSARRATFDTSHDDIIAEYRAALSEPAAVPEREWRPVVIGPTWRVGPDGRWLLPERTLGWHVLAWCGRWLQHGRGRPWRFTLEQARFVLWWYALEPDGSFTFRDGVLQRLKGWGKDPLGACLCAVEAFGPCRFLEWDDDGEPVATDCPEAWVQTAATALEQTKNTMRLFPGLFTAEARLHYRLQIGKETIHGLGDTRLVQAVTSSPATLEGARSTFVLRNETHHWLANNEGHEMAAVIDRNVTKSADGAARALSITNAYEPGEDSVAQRDRDAFDLVLAGTAVPTGLLYDSLEAPPNAPLTAEAAPGVVEAIRGDSEWLNTDRIVKAILDVRNPASRSRRFWYNQITATEDAWLTPQEWDRCYAERTIADGDAVTLGFDGSKSDDHSALIGCHVELDHLFTLGVWIPDPVTGEIDRADVDRVVRAAFARFDVVGFYADLEDWQSYIDTWAEEFGPQLCTKATLRQPIAWDIRAHLQMFTAAVERFHDAVVEEQVTHDGDARSRLHFHNARRAPNRWGISVRKEHRESPRKIDSVPAAVLARLARMDYVALPANRRRKRRTGRASFL